ncbi:FAST kinase domain-containing protein 2, mitochondrial [Brachyhypopomus gauderio]|uniref:FAST kinase domain-containing protein 2, mitochondrial n=1 Tax=Brachyhypopomus gauderio TaxID=698409 RepID=UPI004041C9BC
MNVLKKGEKMLTRTIFLSRFISLWKPCSPHSQIKPATHACRDNCTRYCLQHKLQGHALTNVRQFCQGEAQASSFNEHVNNQSRFQAPTFIAGRNRDTPGEADVSVPFHTKLQECLLPCDVLDLVDRYTPTHRLVSISMTRMWNTTKKMSREERSCELKLVSEHPAFERLCHRARMEAPHMASTDLSYTLLALIKLGVSQRSLVVQTVLRVVQERLNQFDEKSISILATCLEELDSDKNTDALKQGLKLLLEDRFPAIQNVMLLQTTMRLLGKNASPALKKKLEAKALSMVEKFTQANAEYMLTTLAIMHLNSKPLLDFCSRKLAEKVHSVPFTKLIVWLKSYRELGYRNFFFFSSISDYLVNTLNMWTNKEVILLLLEFEGLGFCPVSLLDAFAERLIQNPDSLALRDLLSILKTYSSLNHDLKGNRQEFLANVTHMLESYLPDMSSGDLLKAVSCLSVLDHFPHAPLQELLQDQRLEELLHRDGQSSTGVERKLHMLSLCLRLDGPALPPSLAPVPDFPSILSPHHGPVNLGLLNTLRSLVGDAALQDSVLVEGMHFIDCVITLSPEAEDVCSHSEKCFKTSEKPQRIALLCAPPLSFCFGTTRPRGSLALKIRHLKILGYEPVLVPIHELETHTDQDRVKVLKALIFSHQESSRTEDQMKVD